ncbi:MAG: hypothetical protein M3Z49_07855 [Bifidobacteriales bacterium]|nr:hypothetical protein [Bifidobacterium sp.]MCT6919112.1 hypothetical protein [Bifidobacteriales bacterium]
MPVTPDQLALVMVNDTCQAWEGRWWAERRRLDGTVLADQITRVSIPAGGQAQGSGGHRGYLRRPCPGDPRGQYRPAEFC